MTVLLGIIVHKLPLGWSLPEIFQIKCNVGEATKSCALF